MKEPFLYEGRDAVLWSFGQIVEVVQDATAGGYLQALVKDADQAGIVVRIPPDTINFVKKFLFQAGHHKISEKARGIVRSAACGGGGGGGPPVFPPPGPGDPPPHGM